jgi:PAS domain S-box-containing protein
MEIPHHLSESQPIESAQMRAELFALIADSVICTDENGRIVLFNKFAEKTFGYSAAEVLWQHVEMLLPQRHRAVHVHQVRNFASGNDCANRLMGHEREVCGRRKNGEEFPSEATLSRHTIGGRTIMTAVVRDITARRELDRRHETIEHELDHRIKNVFSVVSSLVSLSAKSAASVEDFRDALQERLQALAQAQDLLRRGARGIVSLRDLFFTELSAYRSLDGSNLVIKAENVDLGWNSAQTVALAIHELATNAAKYGAFSDAGGRVTVTCETSKEDEPMLAIEWRETGGPPVKQPTRQGFGTTLIEQIIKRTFHADIILDYRPEGLVCRMIFPKAAVEAIPRPLAMGVRA